MRKKDKLKELKKAERKLFLQRMLEIKARVFKSLENTEIENGKSKEEIAFEVFKKPYVSQAELKITYKAISQIRNESPYCLAYRGGKYGWAHDKQTIDEYNLTNGNNGLKKLKKAIQRSERNYKVEGIVADFRIPIREKCKQFQLEYIG